MLKKTISVQDVCDLLNEMLVIDYDCINTLITRRVKCNDTTADHPTIQARRYEFVTYSKLGLLGFLNGLFGIREDGMGAICMEIENHEIQHFKPTP